MPGKNGMELARIIKHKAPNLPVFVRSVTCRKISRNPASTNGFLKGDPFRPAASLAGICKASATIRAAPSNCGSEALPGQRSQMNALPNPPGVQIIDHLSEEQLDELPYGVIQLSPEGIVLGYNVYRIQDVGAEES